MSWKVIFEISLDTFEKFVIMENWPEATLTIIYFKNDFFFKEDTIQGCPYDFTHLFSLSEALLGSNLIWQKVIL